MDITPKQFFSEALYRPFNQNYSKKTQVIAVISAIAIGIFSLGIFFLVKAIRESIPNKKMIASQILENKISAKVEETLIEFMPIEEKKLSSFRITSYSDLEDLLLNKCSDYINEQKKLKLYKRNKLIDLDPKNLNIPFKLTNAPSQIQYFAEKSTFYGYNAETTDDFGWGCAWRAIQTCLSAYDLEYSFEKLFFIFGQFEHLKIIYQNKYPEKATLNQEKKFAPFDLSSGWAEPFIAEMVMHFSGISARLESINGVPNSCHAPRNVFPDLSYNFRDFKSLLKTHFQKENSAPIMIDDGTYALAIVGFGENETETFLWMADPHIRSGLNPIPSETTPGLYTVTLNEEGQQIARSLTREEESKLAFPGSFKGLNFQDKEWMVLIPE